MEQGENFVMIDVMYAATRMVAIAALDSFEKMRLRMEKHAMHERCDYPGTEQHPND
jgi:hypothetical protein